MSKRCWRICTGRTQYDKAGYGNTGHNRADIGQHAVDTSGNEDRALRRMRQPLAELDERTPKEVLLEGGPGEAIEAILTRIDYGVDR